MKKTSIAPKKADAFIFPADGLAFFVHNQLPFYAISKICFISQLYITFVKYFFK